MSLSWQIDAALELRRREKTKQTLTAPARWDQWLTTLFPKHFNKPFAKRHREFWEWIDGIEPGVRPPPFFAIWGRGGAKCLAENTEVLLSNGLRVPIQDIKIGDNIISYNETTGKMSIDMIVNKFNGGEKEVIELKTKSRKIVHLTRGHKVLTFDGWKKAGDLTLDDRIASPRYTPIDPYIQKSDEEIRFTAYMLAEGGTSTKSNCYWPNADSVLVDDFIYCANSMGFSVNESGKFGYYISGASDWVKQNGLRGSYAFNKKIPVWIFGLSEKQKWMFLSAFIDTDGWIQKDRSRIGITLASHEMIIDLQYLFMQLGVVTTIYKKDNEKSGAWAVVVANEYIEKCYKNLPLQLKKEKLEEGLKINRYSLLDVYPASVCQSLPFGINRKIRTVTGMKIGNSCYDVTRGKLRRAIDCVPLDRWLFLENADIFWDKIISIKDAGAKTTYDVEVKDNHNLITNGIISHNSMSAEGAVIRLAAGRIRNYAWYISSTQDKADQHVDSIGSMLESSETNKYYPEIADRAVNKFGNSKGWRRSRLRTASGFTIDALGLDTGARGGKMDEHRPDLIIIDDVDELFDSFATTIKKIKTLQQTILPAGSNDCAVLFIQNLITSDSIAARLLDGRADFMTDKIISGPHPAIENMEYEQRDGKFIITGGKPTWEGQSLEVCQTQIMTWGFSAFMQEAQHRIDKTGGIWDEIDFQHVKYINLPNFVRTAVWVDPAVSSTDDSDSMGISAGGITTQKVVIGLYWWEDITTPEDAMEKAIRKAIEIKSLTVGVETDQGGDTWRSVYIRAMEKIKEKIRKEVTLEVYNSIQWPRFTSVKAGGSDETTGHAYGSKVERNSKMLLDYENGMVKHMIGTHNVIESALRRFPRKPLDVADSWFWTYNDLKTSPKVVGAVKMSR